eukprot:3066642-Amphidinium_carterae.2
MPVLRFVLRVYLPCSKVLSTFFSHPTSQVEVDGSPSILLHKCCFQFVFKISSSYLTQTLSLVCDPTLFQDGLCGQVIPVVVRQNDAKEEERNDATQSKQLRQCKCQVCTQAHDSNLVVGEGFQVLCIAEEPRARAASYDTENE